MTAAEVRGMVRDAVREGMGERNHVDEKPLTVKEFADFMGVDQSRVREWCDAGMPFIQTGEVRGKRIWRDKGRTWLEGQKRG
jgi:hypothetical protein